MQSSDGVNATEYVNKNSERKKARKFLVGKYVKDDLFDCFFCHKTFEVKEMTIDRWPRCGHRGGRYTEDNVVPACITCNNKRGLICMDNLPSRWRKRIQEKVGRVS